MHLEFARVDSPPPSLTVGQNESMVKAVSSLLSRPISLSAIRDIIFYAKVSCPAIYTNPVYIEQLLLATFALIDESILSSALGMTDNAVRWS
jgi:hypothetical protein